ncbi:hypothetical protein [Bradyrhizobium sp. DOA9]|uniref:hypothetical protein n=1 Tax=Bradyrhizobium sp. DOA9 TaxID=1126627 RepID=UPI00046AAB21|nr:hypothetical protein [Bradyrhizobium sp. DOA9]
MPNDLDDVRTVFSKRGGYQKFKALLSRRVAIDVWRDYRNKATERALRDWCEIQAIEITD